MSNVVRIHRRPGSRIRLVRADAHFPASGTMTVDDPQVSAGEQAGTPTAAFRSEAVPIPAEEPDHAALLAHAFEQGRLQGRAEQEAEMREQLRVMRSEADERIGALMEGIAHQVRVFTTHLEHDAYTFAIAVAGRIVKREISLDNDVVVRQVREAIRRIMGVEAIRLRIHPDDEELIRAHRASLMASGDTIREVAIDPDDSIERGGCVIESSSGNVDARIATQLRQVESALFSRAEAPQERLI